MEKAHKKNRKGELYSSPARRFSAGTALLVADSTLAQPYRPDERRELAPGVRVVEVSEREAMHGAQLGTPSLQAS
jgi:hypothetical protein